MLLWYNMQLLRGDIMDKMNINNLLTVEDLINLGKPDSNQKFTDFHIEILKTYK